MNYDKTTPRDSTTILTTRWRKPWSIRGHTTTNYRLFVFYHKNKINHASFLQTFAQKHIANRAIMVYNFLAFSLVDGICKQTSCLFDWLDFDKQPFQCYLQTCQISFQFYRQTTLYWGSAKISQNQIKIKVFKSERIS